VSSEAWRTFTEFISLLDKLTLLMIIAAIWCSLSWAQACQACTHSAA